MAENIECAVGITDSRCVRVRRFGITVLTTDDQRILLWDKCQILSHCLRSVIESTYKANSSVLHNGEPPTVY